MNLGGSEYDRVYHKPFTLDGVNAAHGVAYAVVSMDDLDAWETRHHGGSYSSVISFDTRDAALRLRSGLVAATPQTHVGVFYDPVYARSDEYSERMTVVRINDVAMASAAQLGEWLGATATMDEESNTLTLVMGTTTLEITEGWSFATLNGHLTPLVAVTPMYTERLFAPISFLVETFGGKVTLDTEAVPLTVTHPYLSKTLTLTPQKKTPGALKALLSSDTQKDEPEIIGHLGRHAHEAGKSPRTLLRRQVKDFLTWLKVEGVI
jgi:hypothetical protein